MSRAERAASLRLDFHGVGLELESDWPSLARLLRARLSSFPTDTSAAPDLVFRFVNSSCVAEVVPRPAGRSRSIYEAPRGEVAYFPDRDELFFDDGGDARFLVTPRRGETLVAFRRGKDKLWLLSHPMLTLALIELMKRRNLFSVHAAGVAVSGRALLLAGTSGAGKSTLTLALLERGLEFLGDDMLFLHSDRSAVRVLAFPDEVEVTSQTLRMFPRLNVQMARRRRPGWTKWQVEDAGPSLRRITWEADPAILIFPTVAGTRDSRLHPLSRAEALIELAPNVLLTDPRASQAHLDALVALVARVDCYRLETGTDLDAATEPLVSLLGQATAK